MPRSDSNPPSSRRPIALLSLTFLLLVLGSILGLDYIRWKKGGKAYLFPLFGTTETAPEEIRPKAVSAPQKPLPQINIPEKTEVFSSRVALIIDDMGYDLNILRELNQLGLSLTIAVLPYSPWARETAQRAQELGFEVILHLPLESLNDLESNANTEGLIHSRMDESEALSVLENDLAQIPFISGVNNHMGSRMTALRDLMAPLMARLKEQHLYFIDSVTTGSSVAYDLAKEIGVPSASRDVFLDSEKDEGFIRKQLLQLLMLAKKRGTAIGICHPYDSTFKVLEDQVGLFEQYGCQTVFASQVVR